MTNVKEDFFITGNVDFNDRLKTTFGILDNIVPNVRKTSRYTEDEFLNTKSKLYVSTLKNELKQFRGQESIFKKPDVPKKHSFKLNVPDYIKNPHKWKRYHLGDYVITDKSNREVAMKFLKELHSRKEAMKVEDVATEPIKFNRHIVRDDSNLCEKEERKPEFRDSKIIMPEYVIGQKIKKPKIVQKQLGEEFCKSNVKLDHLLEDDC